MANLNKPKYRKGRTLWLSRYQWATTQDARQYTVERVHTALSSVDGEVTYLYTLRYDGGVAFMFEHELTRRVRPAPAVVGKAA